MPSLSRCLVIVVVGILLMIGACGSEGDTVAATDVSTDSVVVTSDDGSATLTVPLTSLPEGLDPSELSVTRVADAALGDDAADAAVYVLGPDGTQLGAGAYLTTSVDMSNGYLPTVMQISTGDMDVDGSEEPLSLIVDATDGVRIVLDADSEMAEVVAPIEHFSSVIITRSEADYAFFHTTWKFGRAPVGQKPASALTITRNTDQLTSGNYPGVESWEVHASDLSWHPRWFYLPVETHTHYKENDGKKGTISLRFTLIDGSAGLKGSYAPGPDTTVLTPTDTITNRPPSTPFNDSYTIPNVDFTCSAEGFGQIHYSVSLYWDEASELQRAWDPTWRGLYLSQKNVFLEVLGNVKCDPASATTTTTSAVTETTLASSTTGTVILGDATYAVTVPTRVTEGSDLEFQVCGWDSATSAPLTGITGYFSLGRDPGGPDASHASGTFDAEGCFSGSVPVKEGPGPTGAYTSNGSEAALAAEVEILPGA